MKQNPTQNLPLRQAVHKVNGVMAKIDLSLLDASIPVQLRDFFRELDTAWTELKAVIQKEGEPR